MYASTPTWYRGLRFASKLEAQWARLLDALEVAYVHQPRHAYRWPPAGDAETAVRYMPDFWLPASNQFLEVKPFDPFRDADDPRWASKVPLVLRKARAVATDAQFQGGVFGAITLAPHPVPPITFADGDGGLVPLDHHGWPLPDAALVRCAACGGWHVGAYAEATPPATCPCCAAAFSASTTIRRPPLPLPAG